MSAALVIEEIRRFLASEKAEVLCVKGRWGVGKTYAWRHYLHEARRDKTLHATKYSYVSLFGLNSLDDVRYAIFEGTVAPAKALTGPDIESVGDLLEKGKSLGRRARGWAQPVFSIFNAGGVGDMIARSAFLLVRNQLICLDDLERAGAGLSVRDLLGLVSFLKDQRQCQVVLLLNDEAIEGEDGEQFKRLLEKVVDTAVLFAPSPTEAAAIAVEGDDAVSNQLRSGVVTLGITNIRVIKKIERLAQQLAELLPDAHEMVLSQGITACMLGGWAVYEPAQAPSLDFLRDYNSLLAAMREREDGPEDEVVRWRDRLDAMPYGATDDFDTAIFDAAEAGYFNATRLRDEASKLQGRIEREGRVNPLAMAWNRYREALTDDDEVVIDAIEQGARESLAITDSLNMNATIAFLREQGRNSQADEIVQAYVAAQPADRRYFEVRNHHFPADQPIDAVLAAAFAERLASIQDERDPKAVLLDIGHGRPWQDIDLDLIATVDADGYEAMFEGTEGPDLAVLVRIAQQISQQHFIDRPALQEAIVEALSRIAIKSPLRARRLRQWGFTLPADG